MLRGVEHEKSFITSWPDPCTDAAAEMVLSMCKYVQDSMTITL